MCLSVCNIENRKMKRFKRLPILFQWLISILFLGVLIIIMSWWIEQVSENKIWVLLIFIMVPLIQFLITPLFTVLNWYTYYAPMVVTFGNNKRVIDLHNGTSFDYLFEMSKVKRGMQWKKKMLSFYLKALYNIIEDIETQKLSDTIIVRGSSYFLSERSVKKMGFRIKETSFAEKLNITLNYLDLIWMYSLTNGRLTFPNLSNISTVNITGAELVKKKDKIGQLLDRLNQA